MNNPNWKRRCEELIKAINLLSETSVYSPKDGCNIPISEAWEFLENAAQYYSSPNGVKPLKIPVLKKSE